jgi:hypothetical protein
LRPNSRSGNLVYVKRTPGTVEVKLHKLSVALDALLAKRKVKTTAARDWWMPWAIQVECPWTGKKSPAALPDHCNTLIRRALRYVTGCSAMACVRPLKEEEKAPGAY